jgi:D-xylonolactonase
VAASDRIETLASGYGLVEGLRVHADDHLYFSDVIEGGVYRRSPEGEIEPVVPKRRGVGGIVLHADGGVVVSGRSVCHVRDGHTRVLLEIEGAAFNDLVTDSAGCVCVGSLRSSAFLQGGERQPGELYRIDAEGRGVALYRDVSLSNGVGFSPDGRILYHSDTGRNQILAHDVTDEGRCRDRRVLATPPRGAPDGLAVDSEGFVWIAAYGGGCVFRFASDGSLDRRVEVPAHRVTTLCFGGADRRDLYIASADNTDDEALGGSIFRTRAPAPGLEVPLARV